MLGIILGISAAIAIGALIVYAIRLTVKWIVGKIKEKMAAKNVKKTAVADIRKLIDECDNKVSLDELEKLSDRGCSHVMVSVDANDNVVGDVEFLEDKNDSLDQEVEQLLGHQRMVIVEG